MIMDPVGGVLYVLCRRSVTVHIILYLILLYEETRTRRHHGDIHYLHGHVYSVVRHALVRSLQFRARGYVPNRLTIGYMYFVVCTVMVLLQLELM